MKDREENLPQDKDPNLDIPSEANSTKHINFLDVEDTNNDTGGNRKDDETAERQKQWQRGIEEGKKARNDE